MKEEILLLKEDLVRAIEVRDKSGRSCFTEELMILRVNEMLKLLEVDANEKEV